MTPLSTFEEAINEAGSNRHLLLGNGFSRACRNDLFAYDALFTEAKDKLSPTARSAFDALGTTDFEQVMRALRQAVSLIDSYESVGSSLSQRLRRDADDLRDVLAQVIASNHPELSNEIGDTEFSFCRRFILQFNTIYTLNYDLLLYWALMKDDLDNLKLPRDDGFREPEEGPQEYVTWNQLNTDGQNVFYMHGALHIFDAGSEVQKYTWSNTGIPLIEQIRDALASNRYPLYVSEGDSKSKLNRVMHSAYLSRGYRSLVHIRGSLFVFGHSLQDSDEHVLKCIEGSNITDLFVSIFGDPDSDDNKRIINRALNIATIRERSRKGKSAVLNVKFYDAESAKVWG